jgi:hypothetical protein
MRMVRSAHWAIPRVDFAWEAWELYIVLKAFLRYARTYDRSETWDRL